MKYNRTYNFSAGPAMMPEPVLEEIRDEMMNYRGSGMCVMEMSHRSKVFQQIADEAEADLRDLMGIPDNYKVLFIQGGATLQFAAVPWNLMKNGKAVYIETGAWSKKAIAEAKKYGEVIVAASSKDKNYSYIPDCSDLDIPEDTDYVYICENETINGTTYYHLPNTKGKILEKTSQPKEGLLIFKGYIPEFLEPGQMLTSTEDQKNAIYTAFLSNEYAADLTEVDMTDQYDIVVYYGDRIRFDIGNANEISYKLRLAATAIPRLNDSKKYNLRMVGDNQISATQQEPAVTTAPENPTEPESTETITTTAAPAA